MVMESLAARFVQIVAVWVLTIVGCAQNVGVSIWWQQIEILVTARTSMPDLV